MKSYTEEFRESILKRMLPPESASVPQLALDTGVNNNTLHYWRRKWIKEGKLTVNKREQRSVTLSGEERFQVVLETSSLNTAELSAYCRERGYYPEEVAQWRASFVEANSAPPPVGQSSADKREIRRLKKELNRKEKALAETAALLVLAKKCQAIWGEDADV